MLFVPFSEKNVTKSKRSNTAHTKWNDSRTYERYTSTKSNIKQNKALHDYVHQCIPLGELQHVFKHMSESDISQRLRHATRVPIPRDAHSAFPKIEDQTSHRVHNPWYAHTLPKIRAQALPPIRLRQAAKLA